MVVEMQASERILSFQRNTCMLYERIFSFDPPDFTRTYVIDKSMKKLKFIKLRDWSQ